MGQSKTSYYVALAFLGGLGILTSVSMGDASERANTLAGDQYTDTHLDPTRVATLVAHCVNEQAGEARNLSDELLQHVVDTCTHSVLDGQELTKQNSATQIDPLLYYRLNENCVSKPVRCPPATRCPLLANGLAKCVVTDCGLGTCPTCPNPTGNLIIKGWCAYGCEFNGKPVGGAVEFKVSNDDPPLFFGPVCFGK